jgi:hypothetical protein
MGQGGFTRLQIFCPDERQESIKLGIQAMVASDKAKGISGCQVLYSDICCKDRPFYVFLGHFFSS